MIEKKYSLKPLSELIEGLDICEDDVNEDDVFELTEVYRQGDYVLYEHEDEDMGSTISEDTIRELFPEFEIDPQKFYSIEINGEFYYE